jgi:peptidase YpeB-like protein
MKVNPITKFAALAAIVFGLAAGSYGIASAASGSGTTTTSTTATPAQSAAAPNAQQPWGGQRSDETLLTGDTLAKVTAAAQAKVSGGTIVRVETDADGHAAYEAHMTKSDGTPVTVYVDKSFDVVSVETR